MREQNGTVLLKVDGHMAQGRVRLVICQDEAHSALTPEISSTPVASTASPDQKAMLST